MDRTHYLHLSMMERDFYLTLPSNSSGKIFPGNTQTEYRTNLAQPLIFEGDWEVALTELTFPVSWYNIEDGNNWFIHKPSAPKPAEENSSSTTDTATPTPTTEEGPPVINSDESPRKVVPPGFYPTADDVIGRIAGDINYGDNSLSYGGSNVPLSFGDSYEFSDGLSDILGVRRRRAVASGDVGTQPPDVHAFHHAVYVYCDFIEPQLVGDYSVPLLHQMAVRYPHFGEYITSSPIHLAYLPVRVRELYAPLIYLRDEAGKKINFKFGMVTVLLHFRKKV